MGCGNFKDLPRATVSYKVLYDNAFYIAKNSEYHGYPRHIASLVFNSFIKCLLPLTQKQELIII